MRFIKTEIPEIIVCLPDLTGDHRGYFSETFRQDKLTKFIGHPIEFCQDNESKSTFGVLRGLHYQKPPFAQSKLVRVIDGKILDVAVDMRQGSPSFGQSVSVELSSENRKQIFVPRGFAHGFVVLSETATIVYKCDNYYDYDSESGLLYSDKTINIDWKLNREQLILSDKDMVQPVFSNAEKFNFQENLYGQ